MKKKFIIKRYQINTEKPGVENRNLRLVFFSDMHNAVYGEHNRELLGKIRSLKPDAVLLGGDLMISKPDYPLEPALEIVHALAAEYPVYYAMGNHEYRLKLYTEIYGNRYQKYFGRLKDTSVHLLDNQREEADLQGIPVAISGFSLDSSYYRRFNRRELPVSVLEEKLGRPDPARFEILLAHNPYYQKTYFEWGADLILSGHYHGGVVRIGESRGIITPDFHPFSRKCYGIKKREGQQMIVTSGLGEHTIPIRLFNPRELVILDIFSA